MKILVLNAGSSTLKASLFAMDKPHAQALWSQTWDWDISQVTEEDFRSFLTPILHESLYAIGHRVVHGGNQFKSPVLINEEVKKAIADLAPLAPLHNPLNLKGIEWMEHLLPQVPQVAVFDTAFHSHLPSKARTYPIPEQWRLWGIEKYGFHGISHAYCANKAAEILKKPLNRIRMITCHLGNGSSLAAVKDGTCIETTMGFTPLEGLMMGTRSGSIDPGVLLYLLREKNFTEKMLDNGLNDESGLKGIAGDSDMRILLQRRREGDGKAKLAIEMYVYRLQCAIGALTGALQGVEAIVFTGGIGENATEIRAETCQSLEFLGAQLDPHLNQSKSSEDRVLSLENSRIQILTVHTREDLAIAKSAMEVIR